MASNWYGFMWPGGDEKDGDGKKNDDKGNGGGKRTPLDNDSSSVKSAADEQTVQKKEAEEDSSRKPSRQDVGNQARVLIARFVHDRMEVDGLPPIEEDLLEPGVPQGANVISERACREVAWYLRRIGDELDRDENIQRMFGSLEPTAPHATFLRVARNIFADGNYTWGRVVALFYFAYRMATKSYGRIHLLRTIIEWVVSFIMDVLSEWIIGRGGWLGIREHFGTPTTAVAGILLVAGTVVGLAWLRGR